MDNVEFAPIRNLADFMLESARFQVPNFKDPDRVVNRVINNLLYYQTNYFLTTIAMFLIVGLLHPAQMIFGIAAMVGVFVLFVYVTNNKSQCRRFKRNHPGWSCAIVLGGAYILIHFLGSVAVFLFGIAAPVLAIITHATLRMRNIKNKITNKIEYVGIKRTPMGLLLEALGQEQEAGS